jgi:branched-chain amino acid transport system substrate-binding protein
VVVLLAPPGCVSSEDVDPPAGSCGLKVAVLGPLTGHSADHGANIRAGAELAFRQYNAGHAACPAELVSFDSQGDPKQAPALAQQIVEDPRIVGVIGPAFSGEAEAALPILDQGRVTTITTSATRTNLSQRGWHSFHRLVGNDDIQGRGAAWYIERTLRAHSVFVINDTGAYGRGLADTVVFLLGKKVVHRATILPRQTDFSAVGRQISSAGADVVFFAGYYAEAGRLLRHIREMGMSTAFVAGDGVKADGFVRTAGARAAEGTVITCPCMPPEHAAAGFPQHYQAAFGRIAGTSSAEAYDAATIFLAGIQAGKSERPHMEAFVDAFDRRLVTTTVRWTPNGELVSSSVTIWAFRVRDGLTIAEQRIPVIWATSRP